MKSLAENIRYAIWQAAASLFGILAFIFLFIPAIWNDKMGDDSPAISLMQLTSDSGGIMYLGIICIILGTVASLALTVLLFINKSNEKLTTGLAIGSIVTILIGAVILACSFLYAKGFTDYTALSLNQGVIKFEAAYFLVPVFGLLTIVASYPSAMIILHHQDLVDKEASKSANE